MRLLGRCARRTGRARASWMRRRGACISLFPSAKTTAPRFVFSIYLIAESGLSLVLKIHIRYDSPSNENRKAVADLRSCVSGDRSSEAAPFHHRGDKRKDQRCPESPHNR